MVNRTWCDPAPSSQLPNVTTPAIFETRTQDKLRTANRLPELMTGVRPRSISNRCAGVGFFVFFFEAPDITTQSENVFLAACKVLGVETNIGTRLSYPCEHWSVMA